MVGVATGFFKSGTKSAMLLNEAWVLPSYGGRGFTAGDGGRWGKELSSSFIFVGFSFFTGTEMRRNERRVSTTIKHLYFETRIIITKPFF